MDRAEDRWDDIEELEYMLRTLREVGDLRWDLRDRPPRAGWEPEDATESELSADAAVRAYLR